MRQWHVAKTFDWDDRKELAERTARRQAQSALLDSTWSVDSRASVDSQPRASLPSSHVTSEPRRKRLSNGAPPRNTHVRTKRFVKLLRPHVLHARATTMDYFVVLVTWMLWKRAVEEIKQREVAWRIEVLEAQGDGNAHTEARLQRSLQFLASSTKCREHHAAYSASTIQRACFFLWRGARQLHTAEEEQRAVVQKWKDDVWNIQMQCRALEAEHGDKHMILAEEKESMEKQMAKMQWRTRSLKSQLQEMTKKKQLLEEETKAALERTVHSAHKLRHDHALKMAHFRMTCVNAKVGFTTSFRCFHEWRRRTKIKRGRNFLACQAISAIYAKGDYDSTRATFAAWLRYVRLRRRPLSVLPFRLLAGRCTLLERHFSLWRAGVAAHKHVDALEKGFIADITRERQDNDVQLERATLQTIKLETEVQSLGLYLTVRGARALFRQCWQCWRLFARRDATKRRALADGSVVAFGTDTLLRDTFHTWAHHVRHLHHVRHRASLRWMSTRFEVSANQLTLHLVITHWKASCRDNYRVRQTRESPSCLEDHLSTKCRSDKSRMRQFMDRVLTRAGDKLDAYVFFNAWRRCAFGKLDRVLAAKGAHMERAREEKVMSLLTRRRRTVLALVWREWVLAHARDAHQSMIAKKRGEHEATLRTVMDNSLQWNLTHSVFAAWDQITRVRIVETHARDVQARAEKVLEQSAVQFQTIIRYVDRVMSKTMLRTLFVLWATLRGRTNILQEDLKVQKASAEARLKQANHETFAMQQRHAREKAELEQQLRTREAHLQNDITKWTRKASGNEMRVTNLKRTLNAVKSSYEQACVDRDEAMQRADDAAARLAKLEGHALELRTLLSESVDTGYCTQRTADQWASAYVARLLEVGYVCRERYLQFAPFTVSHVCFTRWRYLTEQQRHARTLVRQRCADKKQLELHVVVCAWTQITHVNKKNKQVMETSDAVIELTTSLDKQAEAHKLEKHALDKQMRDMEHRMLKAEELVAFKEEQLHAALRLLAATSSLDVPTRP